MTSKTFLGKDELLGGTERKGLLELHNPNLLNSFPIYLHVCDCVTFPSPFFMEPCVVSL